MGSINKNNNHQQPPATSRRMMQATTSYVRHVWWLSPRRASAHKVGANLLPTLSGEARMYSLRFETLVVSATRTKLMRWKFLQLHTFDYLPIVWLANLWHLRELIVAVAALV
jgi:hypothetical protein